MDQTLTDPCGGGLINTGGETTFTGGHSYDTSDWNHVALACANSFIYFLLGIYPEFPLVTSKASITFLDFLQKNHIVVKK